MYRWLVLLHVLGVFGFLMAHGISAGVAFALRRERNREHIQALLNLSGSSIGVLYASIAILLLTGIVSGFIGHWWGRGWIWLSLVVLVAILAYMSRDGSGFYSRVRKAVGLGYMEGYKPHAPVEPAADEELDTLLRQAHPIRLAAVGLGGLAVLAWLMMFKPF